MRGGQTVGAAFGAKTIQVDRRMVTMGIWVNADAPGLLAVFLAHADRAGGRAGGRAAVCHAQDTAGSERFEAMSKIYYRDAKAAVVCFGMRLGRAGLGRAGGKGKGGEGEGRGRRRARERWDGKGRGSEGKG